MMNNNQQRSIAPYITSLVHTSYTLDKNKIREMVQEKFNLSDNDMQDLRLFLTAKIDEEVKIAVNGYPFSDFINLHAKLLDIKTKLPQDGDLDVAIHEIEMDLDYYMIEFKDATAINATTFYKYKLLVAQFDKIVELTAANKALAAEKSLLIDVNSVLRSRGQCSRISAAAAAGAADAADADDGKRVAPPAAAADLPLLPPIGVPIPSPCYFNFSINSSSNSSVTTSVTVNNNNASTSGSRPIGHASGEPVAVAAVAGGVKPPSVSGEAKVVGELESKVDLLDDTESARRAQVVVRPGDGPSTAEYIPYPCPEMDKYNFTPYIPPMPLTREEEAAAAAARRAEIEASLARRVKTVRKSGYDSDTAEESDDDESVDYNHLLSIAPASTTTSSSPVTGKKRGYNLTKSEKKEYRRKATDSTRFRFLEPSKRTRFLTDPDILDLVKQFYGNQVTAETITWDQVATICELRNDQLRAMIGDTRVVRRTCTGRLTRRTRFSTSDEVLDEIFNR